MKDLLGDKLYLVQGYSHITGIYHLVWESTMTESRHALSSKCFPFVRRWRVKERSGLSVSPKSQRWYVHSDQMFLPYTSWELTTASSICTIILVESHFFLTQKKSLNLCYRNPMFSKLLLIMKIPLLYKTSVSL